MAQSFDPGQYKEPCVEKKVDFGTHLIEGPIQFDSMAEVLEYVLEESVIKNMPTGEPVSLVDFLECGSVTFTEANQKDGIVLNGAESKPMSGFSDSEGIYPYTTIGINEGCCAWVNICIPTSYRSKTKLLTCNGHQLTACNGQPLAATIAVPC